MALDRFEVRVSIQKVLLGLVLVIVPLSIVGLVLTTRSDTALDASIGGHLKTMAQMYSNSLSHEIHDRVSAVKLIAADPGVVEAVTTANRAYQNQNEAAINEKLDKAEKAWATPQAAPVVKALLTAKPSETLRHYHDMDQQMLRITVTDEHGVPVAATAKPNRYTLTSFGPWQSVYDGGKGAVSISNILYDEPTKAYFVDIGVPVTEPGTNQLAGVALASVNITPLLASFQQDNIGNGWKAYLVNSDGTVVSGPRTDVFARARSDEYAALGDSLGSIEGRQTGYVTADLQSGRHIVGFSDTGLAKTYKNMAWTVLISQEEHEAIAPIRALSMFAIMMVVLALFMVTLLAVYYALHRKQQFADIEDAASLRQQGITPPQAV
jgi:preprotein translocase subunit SecG